MTRKTFEKLNFKKIQKINWANADLIRDKGNGKNEDTYGIVFPLITIKRFMDLREEDKIKLIRLTDEYDFSGNDLVKYLEISGQVDKRFPVLNHLKPWYDIEWEDILRFESNPDGEEIEYQLGHNEDEDFSHRLTIKTRAKNRIEFLYEVIESFDNKIIHEMLDEYEFKKIFSKVLPFKEQKEALDTFKDVKYYLEYASNDVFGDVFMDITARFASSGGKKGGEFFTPTELTKAIARMRNFKMRPGQTEFRMGDPTAGACTFMKYAADLLREKYEWNISDINDKVVFITQEKEKTSELFGKLNMAFHGYESHISYHGNTITNWKTLPDGSRGGFGTEENNLDGVLANPPYGLKDYGMDYAMSNLSNETRWMYGVPKKGEGEWAFIESIINTLNEHGEAAVIVPSGVLTRGANKSIREKIITEGYIEAVVEMPPKMFLTTDIPVSVIFLKKGRIQEDIEKGIYMMNASECFTKKGKHNVFEGEEAEIAINMFINNEIKKDFAELIDLKTIINNNFEISVNSYVYKEEIREEINIELLNDEITEIYEKISLRNKSVIDMLKG